MPTYDYQCDKCGHLFEAFQNMSDDPLKECPSCNEESLRRLISGGSGVIFKGSGFYVTDSRGNKSGGAGAKTADSKVDGSSGGSSKDSGTSSGSKEQGSGEKKQGKSSNDAA